MNYIASNYDYKYLIEPIFQYTELLLVFNGVPYLVLFVFSSRLIVVLVGALFPLILSVQNIYTIRYLPQLTQI